VRSFDAGRAVNRYRGYCLLAYCDRFVPPAEGVVGYDGFKWQVLCDEHRDEVIDQLALFVLDNLDHDLGPSRAACDLDALVQQYLAAKPLTAAWRDRFDALCDVAMQWREDSSSLVDYSAAWER
jgi:hypothetical protein